MNDNKKAKVWVYAIVLFTSAFVILLLTAYSQIKLNKSLNNYRNEISSKVTENKKVQQNFSSAQEMNEKLNAEIKKLQEENSMLQDNVSSMLAQKEDAEIQLSNKNTAFSNFSTALSVYFNGDYIQCAQLLTQIDQTNLDGKSLELYKSFAPKVEAEAGRILYLDGRSLYKKGQYSSAAEKLLLSNQYAKNQAFSDNCLFYLAYAEIKSGNKTSSVEHMKKLLADYPSSSFRKYAEKFLERYGK